MKKIIFTFMFLTVPFMLTSQTNDFICVTSDDTNPDPPGVYSYSIDQSRLDELGPVVLNVFFWGINQDDGTSDAILTETMALKVIADLNIKYLRSVDSFIS
jgi:hypothetical protein